MAAERAGMRTVLQVLPHPGGGGETYVDALSRMEGYRSQRVYLAPSAKPAGAVRAILRNDIRIQRKAGDYDVVHFHGEVASSICLPALAACRSVVTMNGLHLLRRTSGMKRQLATVNLRLIVGAATRTICVSESELTDVLGVVGGRAAKRVQQINNGVDPLPAPSPEERAAARADLGLAATTTVGVYVGSLDEHKNPLVLGRAAIEVARTGAPFVLLVAGDGPGRLELERLARDSGVDAVRLLGFHSDVRQVLVAADFFVLPSEREGLSFALLEAMSLGLAPVVSDAPGNPDAVGDAGIVVPRGDVEALADAFRRLLDEPLRLSLGRRAHDRVIDQFLADDMVSKTRQVYDDILEASRGAIDR